MDCSLLISKLAEKSALDYLMTFSTLCVAIIVAGITWGQYMVNARKLRLDLYNRRFEIYSKSLNYYQKVLFIPNHPKDDATAEENAAAQGAWDQFNVLQKEFIKAFRESQFLFSAKSGVYKLLEEMDTRSFRMIQWKDVVSKAFHPSSSEWQAGQKQDREDSAWVNGFIPKLETAMADYLDFRNIK
jgi:hypothetical protein